jgi:hypothetical protein
MPQANTQVPPSSTLRVQRYHRRQRQAGRRQVHLYLKPDVIAKLRRLAKGGQYGDVVEQALAELWRVHGNGDGVT